MSLVEVADTAATPSEEPKVPSGIIPLTDLNSNQKQNLIRVAQKLKDLHDITIIADDNKIGYSAKTNIHYESLKRTLDDAKSLLKDGRDISNSRIQSMLRSNIKAVQQENDPVYKAKQAQKEIARQQAEEEKKKRPEPQGHHFEEINDSQVPNATNLAKIIGKSRTTQNALKVLKEIDGLEILSEDKKLRVSFATFEDEELTEQSRKRILSVITKVAAFATSKTRHIEPGMVKKAMHEAPSSKAAAPKTSEPKVEKVALRPVLRVTEFGSKSAAVWANDIDKSGRSACLRAFTENPNFDFDVTLAKDKNEIVGFNITFGPAKSVTTTDVKIAHYVLEQLEAKWKKSGAPTKATTTQWLNEIWEDLDHSSEAEHGDRLKIAFEKIAPAKPIQLGLNSSFKDATSVLPKGDITPKYNILMPTFDRNGTLKFTRESGRSEELTPTPNQSALMNAIRDFYYDYVICQGPAGAGKTLWVCFAALQLLQQGHVHKILYDRPLEGAGGKSIGYLKGDLDEKMGPYHGPFEKAFAKILGHGQLGKGQEIFEDLKNAGMIERYDEIFKRGDTAEDALLIIDEAQNKSRDEVYHLITRPDANSKLILMGDGEFQIDLKNKSSSGFVEMPDIYGRIDKFAFAHLNEDDIKRKDTIREIYLARRDFEAAEKAQREARNRPPQAPAPEQDLLPITAASPKAPGL